jgi:hypothetical protein
MISKKYFISFILIVLPLFSYTQGIRFSAFTDPQITWMKPENQIAESAGVRIGLDTGFELDYFFNQNYAFSTGLSINNIGGKLKFSEPVPIQFVDFSSPMIVDPGDVVIYRIQYLNLPLGMKFTTREIGYSTYYIKLGTTAHFNTRSNANISSLDIDYGNLDNEINSFTYSYHFGAGVHYSLGGRTALTGGIEYKHRFVDITANTDFKVSLNSFAIRLGVLF